MNKHVAEQVARRVLGSLERLGHQELSRRAAASEVEVREVSEEGESFQLEIQYFFDSGKRGPVRIMVAVDDGSLLRTIRPLTWDTIVEEEDST